MTGLAGSYGIALLDALFDQAPVGIGFWDSDLRYVRVNDALAEMNGVPAAEHAGHTIDEVLPGLDREIRGALERVIETGEPSLDIEVSGETSAAPGARRTWRASYFPVRAGGEVLGVGGVVTDITAEAALRSDVERALEEEHGIAHTLQQSLLPERLPELPGIDLAAYFRAAGRHNLVGGDFYDVFEAPEGSWLLVLGDVCGKGPAAAALTSLARHTLRAGGLFTGDPAHLFGVLNESMMRADTGMRFVTVVCARIDRSQDALTLAVASAGHCMPLLVRPDGTVSEVGGKGALLGIGHVPTHAVEEVALAPGDTVVFFTDGVTEALAPERFLEADDLHDVLSGAAGLSAAETLARVAEAGLPAGGEEPRDDVAMLALRRRTDF